MSTSILTLLAVRLVIRPPMRLVTALLVAGSALVGAPLVGAPLVGAPLAGAPTMGPSTVGPPTMGPPPAAPADRPEPVADVGGGVPVVPRDAFGWPLGPDRGLTRGAAGPPARTGEDGSVTRRFRAPPQPYGRGHRGADLAGSPGEPVRAAGAGVVTFAGRVAGRGVVSVDHAGGLRTTYEPVTAAVVVGAPVGRGTPLGTLEAGHAGCPSSACLHWGLRRTASGAPGTGPPDYLDPLLLVGLGHVRLLPTDP